MKKIKSTFLFYLFPFITAFAFTIGNFTPKVSSPKADKFSENNIPIVVPKPIMCSGSNSSAVLVTELWSSPATWGGTKPVAGAIVTIPENKHIIMDENPPPLNGLTIEGTLEFAAKDLNLTSHWIMVMGQLKIGSATNPYIHKATITLTGTDVNQSNMGMGTRGIMVMGGSLELHGIPPTKTWTKINAHAPQGSANLSLLESVNWKVNDQIVVAPTDYIGTGDTQRVSINTISGNLITASAPMNAQRWGLVQYATASGMSLTNAVAPTTVVPGTPTQLDERAEVGNLTRNIVIQSPDDAPWQNSGFGCHIMIMRSPTGQGVAHVNGIEIKRGGQNGIVARYPFHWHMLSYQGTTTLADATGQYIRNSSVNESAQRGIVIHGTNGVEVSKNVLYNIKGHGIFTEDASERRNTIDSNLVLHVRNPVTPMKVHESNTAKGSSGFWISNPDNIITNNVVAGSTGLGFWFAFTTQAWGMSEGIAMNPSRMKFGVFDGNTAHSNGNTGVFFDDIEVDNFGNLEGFKYVSTTDGLEPEWPYPNRLRHMLSRYTTYKNIGSGIWNRAAVPDNDQVISADNCGTFFSGAGDNGLIKRSLVVGNSLNYNMNGVTRPNVYGADQPVAMASYHSSFDLKDNFIINFPAVANTPSGAFNLSDYYLIPVDKGLIRNVNNTLVNSHPGVRTMPSETHFAFGALWDPHDYWGGTVAQDNYYVFNTPFFTHGQIPTVVVPSPVISGGVLVTGPFYGVANFVINKANSPYYPLMELNVSRKDSNMNNVGNWIITQGPNGGLLSNMRHFATHPTGIYDLNFPTVSNVNDLTFEISNMLTTNDYQVVGVEYSGNYLISGLFSTVQYNNQEFGGSIPMPTVSNDETHIYQAVASLAAVRAAPTGEVYWQDRINNKVWFKIRGGLNTGDPNIPSTDDYNLYKRFGMRMFGVAAPLSIESNTFENEAKNLILYPNPSSSEISVKWTNFNNLNDDILVANSIGQIIYKKQSQQLVGENILQIDINNWSSGLYFVKVGKETVKLIKK